MDKKKTLVVDDDFSVADSLRDSLRDSLEVIGEYDIEVAYSGNEALKKVKATEFDAILVDQRMPEMTGVELIEKISQLYKDSPVKPIIWGITAEDDGIMKKAAEQANLPIDNYIQKPWEDTDFTIRFRETIRKRDLIAKLMEAADSHFDKFAEIERRYYSTQKKLSLERESNAILRGSVIGAKSIYHPFRNIIAGLTGRINQIGWVCEDELDTIENLKNEIVSNDLNSEEIVSAIENKLEPVIKKIAEITERLESLIARLNKYAVVLKTITNKSFEAPKIEMRLEKIIDASLEKISNGNLKNIKIIKQYDSSLEIPCYEMFLEDAFFHIIDNSIKAIPDKGEIKISMKSDSLWVIVQIHDTGVGISDETLPHVYVPLFTNGREVYGGIGASLAHKYITDYHKGQVEIIETFTDEKIASKEYPGKSRGTTLEVRIPKNGKRKETYNERD